MKLAILEVLRAALLLIQVSWCFTLCRLLISYSAGINIEHCC